MQINIPGSKSLSQRYLILASLAASPSLLHNISNSEDTLTLMKNLNLCGIKFNKKGNTAEVIPAFPHYSSDTVFNCKNGGTTLRFLIFLPLITKIPAIFDASEQLKNRPADSSFKILSDVGCIMDFHERKNRLPLKITPPESLYTQEFKPDTTKTSQVFSSLLLWGSKFKNGIKLIRTFPTVSESYIDLTLKTLDDFGIKYEKHENFIQIPEQTYKGKEIFCETDCSLAVYPHLASEITGKPANLQITNSISQKDCGFSEILKKMKREKGLEINLNSTPDLLPPLFAASVFYRSGTVFTGIKHTKFKESNRKHFLKTELEKTGLTIYETEDSLCAKGNVSRPANLDAHNDHRLAMTFGLFELLYPEITITGKDSVKKSWPEYWTELKKFSE